MTAADARCVPLHLPKQGAAGVGELAVLLEHRAPLHEVGWRVDQEALRLEAVAAGAPRLLLVVLERSRRAGVDDEADVGAVDAHAERHRRDDDVGALAEERVLVAAAFGVRKACVIRESGHAQFRSATPPAHPPRVVTCSR